MDWMAGLVTAFTTSFLKPIIKAVGGGEDQFAGQWEISKGNFMDWAGFINALITFLLTAAVLYFLVVFPIDKLAERRSRGEEPPPKAPSEEVKLLTEIRDALVSAGHTTPGQQRGALDDVLARRTQPPAPR